MRQGAPPGTESSVDTDQASPGSSTEPAERTEAQSAPEVAAGPREVAGCGPLDTLETCRSGGVITDTESARISSLNTQFPWQWVRRAWSSY